jgi:hypothetical protein
MNPSGAANGNNTGIGGLGAGNGSGTKIDVQVVLTHWLTPTGVQLAKGQAILITARGTLNWYTAIATNARQRRMVRLVMVRTFTLRCHAIH